MTVRRISIFPLPGAILLPEMQLPLHIFEPRYRALVGDALARDRMIGMIQPKRRRRCACLFAVGCLGRIGDVEALDDGRYNIVLEGLQRFTVRRELDVTTPFRQVEGRVVGRG
jgi:Lon protease-like protein